MQYKKILLISKSKLSYQWSGIQINRMSIKKPFKGAGLLKVTIFMGSLLSGLDLPTRVYKIDIQQDAAIKTLTN